MGSTFCLENNIKPILCFGNSKKEEPITNVLDKLENLNDKIIYAYEPVFNIGTNEIDISYVKENIKNIYNYLINKNYYTIPNAI